MSYVLGTHSGHSGLGFIDAATVQKLGSGDKTTALNIFMFGPDQGKSPEERGRRLKEYKLTAPYLIAFEAAKVANGLFGKANNTLTTTQRRTVVNAVTAAFNQAHALAFPAPSGGGEVLETASTGDDNTLLYVAGAAGVALLAFGLMRRKK